MFNFSASAPSLWDNGPAPGSLYNFPGTQIKPNDYFTHSQSPVTTATSVIAVTYNNGVIMAGDLLGSYGSLARYRNCPRILKINENIMLGASGDYGDYQYVKDIIQQKIIEEECLDDGISFKPKSMYCWLTRIMYQRRSKFDPFWNNLVVGGNEDGTPFLGTIDKLGTAYTDKIICTGFGAHIATPLLRDYVEKHPKLGRAKARELIEKCMEVLFYRDARSYSKYLLGTLDIDQGIKIEGPLEINHKWDIAGVKRS